MKHPVSWLIAILLLSSGSIALFFKHKTRSAIATFVICCTLLPLPGVAQKWVYPWTPAEQKFEGEWTPAEQREAQKQAELKRIEAQKQDTLEQVDTLANMPALSPVSVEVIPIPQYARKERRRKVFVILGCTLFVVAVFSAVRCELRRQWWEQGNHICGAD